MTDETAHKIGIILGAAISTSAGALTGAGIGLGIKYFIGGIGVAAMGTAVSVPLIATGAIVGGTALLAVSFLKAQPLQKSLINP